MRAVLLAIVVVFATTGVAIAQKATQGSSPNAAQAPAAYPENWRRNFLEGCMEGPTGQSRAVCECGLRNIERQVPFAESDELDRAGREGRALNPRTLETYQSIMLLCLSSTDT